LLRACTALLVLVPALAASAFHVRAAGLRTNGKTLWHATWSRHLTGWQLDSHWSTIAHTLTYDGSGVSTAIAPYTVSPGHPYVVQARIQDDGHDDTYNGNDGFGIVFRVNGSVDFMPDNPNSTALAAGIFERSDYTNEPDGTFIGLWDAKVYVDSPLRSASYRLDNAWHTYRVEVRGTNVRVLVDGRKVLSCETTKYLSGRGIGIFSEFHQLNVKSFKVIALNVT
jgi:hypothetical protein